MVVTMLACLLLIVGPSAVTGEVILEVSAAEAVAGVCAPVSVRVDLADVFGAGVEAARLRLTELSPRSDTPPVSIPVQLEADEGSASRGALWWLMPPGPEGKRRFRLAVADDDAPAALAIRADGSRQFFDIAEGSSPVLRYNHGTVPVPAGTDPKYARGDYISPLFGPNGEALTDDYPRDHPHHRGVSWSWPVTRWRDEVRDIWAVRGVWARPVAMRRVESGPVMASLEAESVWKWGDTDPIVREEVALRAFRKGPQGRFVDVEVRLTALEDGVAIGGRPNAGYGGFGLRAAPAEERAIALHTDDEQSDPRRSWLDYSGIFAGGKGIAGLTIFEHLTNPGYPNELHQYPHCNYAMPAFPAQREAPLAKDRPLVLKHRLWIHSGRANEATLAAVWAAYSRPPKVVIERD